MAVPVSLGRRQCTSHGGEIQLNNVGIAILSRKFRHVCLDKAKVLIKFGSILVLKSVQRSHICPPGPQAPRTVFINSTSTFAPFSSFPFPPGRHAKAFADLKLPTLELRWPPVLVAERRPSLPTVTTTR